MRKYLIIALLFFLPLISQAKEFKVNEYMNDLYFANGIDTKRKQAQKMLDTVIYKKILKDQYNSNSIKMEKELNFKLAYNNTLTIEFDLLEALNQKKDEHKLFWYSLNTFTEVYGKIAKYPAGKLTNEVVEQMLLESLKRGIVDTAVEKVLDEAGLKNFAVLLSSLTSGVTPKNVWKTINASVEALHEYDLSQQIYGYTNSIKSGHSVIVIAHSQGNLFTNEAYKKIDDDASTKWMLDYFHMIAVASPAGKGTGVKDVEVVTFDNDPITTIPDSIGTPIANPMRFISWVYLRDNTNQTRPASCLDSQYLAGSVPTSCVEAGDIDYDYWESYDVAHIDFHTLDYYMNTNISKEKIMNFVSSSIATHKEASSQWNYTEENEDTKEYRLKVSHSQDSSLDQHLKNKEIYPFNKDKKLYHVADPNNPQNNFVYVKASFAGEQIQDNWSDKKDHQFYKLRGTSPIEYIATSIASSFKIRVKTDNVGFSSDTQFTLMAIFGDYNYSVDCNDDGIDEAVGLGIGMYLCNYDAPGEYVISISGTFSSPFFRFNDDRQKLISIEQWGTNRWLSMYAAFNQCRNMTLNAIDTPDLTQVTDMGGMFLEADSFDGDIGDWNVSNVTNMVGLFGNIRLSTPIYDSLLIGWSKLNLQRNVLFHAGLSNYSADAATARASIISNFNWNINDRGLVQ